jgi:hypothetical protein
VVVTDVDACRRRTRAPEALRRAGVGAPEDAWDGGASDGGSPYAGEWPQEAFRKHGIDYQPSERAKSELYAALLPALNSGRVELLDHTRLAAQLLGPDRRTSRGGRDSIDHAPGGRDDVVNAAAGAVVLASGAVPTGEPTFANLANAPPKRIDWNSAP